METKIWKSIFVFRNKRSKSEIKEIKKWKKTSNM
jgi:hypothetical protein